MVSAQIPKISNIEHFAGNHIIPFAWWIDMNRDLFGPDREVAGLPFRKYAVRFAYKRCLVFQAETSMAVSSEQAVEAL